MCLNKKMICALLIVVGFCACTKEECQKSGRASLAVVSTNSGFSRDGGDDDEEPAIQGLVMDSSGNTLSGAKVELILENKVDPIRTEVCDTRGMFEMTAPVANYYFRVTPVGGESSNTEVFALVEDVHVTIIVE